MATKEEIDKSAVIAHDDWAEKPVSGAMSKELISIRLDRDVLAWYRAQAPRYQKLINAVLRTYKEAVEKGGK